METVTSITIGIFMHRTKRLNKVNEAEIKLYILNIFDVFIITDHDQREQ